MARNIVDELQTLYDKLKQAEHLWLNRLGELAEAADLAAAEFCQHLPSGVSAEEKTGSLTNLILAGLALQGGTAVVAFPLVFGLKKLAQSLAQADALQVEGIVTPCPPNLKEFPPAFRQTTERLGQEIIKVQDRARAASDKITKRDAQTLISKMLLSPVWYPPPARATQNIARPLELRLWFLYWKQLEKTGGYGVDLTGMAKHLKAIGWEPTGVVNWEEFLREPQQANTSRLAALARRGERDMPLNMPHNYPVEVQQYLVKASLSKQLFSTTNLAGTWLPPSTLTWANLAL